MADIVPSQENQSLHADYGKILDTYGNEYAIPEYTIKQIRDAIPPACFDRSAIRSLSYVLRDLLLIASTYLLAVKYITPNLIPNFWLRSVLWSIYGFLNGIFGTGLWVLAHECGHQAFSPSKRLNDTVGFILHSALLVPYFSWKLSHAKHHQSTGHMSRDVGFVPRTRQEFAARVGVSLERLSEVCEDAPLHTLVYIVMRQLLGWPIYLLTNDSGHNYFGGEDRKSESSQLVNGLRYGVNHFNPGSPIFDAKDARLIIISDLGLLAAGTLIKLGANRYGWANMLIWYFLPYVWINSWLVAITFLQHTDPRLPHYTGSSWTFVRGAAATIDHEFGFIGRHFLHRIMETHVLHHYVSRIPFYHAQRATEAIKPVMGTHYCKEVRHGPFTFLAQMYRNVRMCQWVEPSRDATEAGRAILFFRNRQGLGERPLMVRPM